METLLSLTSKRAGDWFKEELRLLGGLDHIVDKGGLSSAVAAASVLAALGVCDRKLCLLCLPQLKSVCRTSVRRTIRRTW